MTDSVINHAARLEALNTAAKKYHSARTQPERDEHLATIQRTADHIVGFDRKAAEAEAAKADAPVEEDQAELPLAK